MSTLPEQTIELEEVSSGSETPQKPEGTPQAKHPREEQHGDLVETEESKATINMVTLAGMFLDEYKVRFGESDGQPFCYDCSSRLWRKVGLPTLKKWLSDYMIRLALERKQPILRQRCKPAFLKNVLEMAASYGPLPELTWRTGELLPLENVVLDLSDESPAARDYGEEDVFLFKMPVVWQVGAQCPKFEELIKSALGDDSEFFQTVVGSMLVPGNPAQVIALIYGEGGSGKSTVLLVLEHLFSHERMADLRTQHLHGRFETHFMMGADALVAKDAPSSVLKAAGAGMLKSLTGGDEMCAEQKFGPKHRMKGTFNVIISSNAKPVIGLDEDAEAWQRRILPFEFKKSAGFQPIIGYDKILFESEGPGILRWMIGGYIKAKAMLKKHGRFVFSPAQKARIEDLIAASQSVEHFVKTRVQSRAGEDVGCDECFKGYLDFCKAKKWKPLSKKKFFGELCDQMGLIHGTVRHNGVLRNGKSVRGYAGVQFIDAAVAITAPETASGKKLPTKDAEQRKAA